MNQSEPLIFRILTIEPIFELSLSIPCLLVNIYFALRFCQLECFSPNLRILLVISNIITSLCTFLHPIPQLIPAHLYSVSQGQYVGAFIVYGLHYFTMVFLMLVDSKFLLVGMERWVAFKMRSSYESRDGSGSIMILKFYILVVAILVALKSAVMFFWLSEGTIDDRLAWSFIADRCVYLFISTTCTAGMTWIICVVQFYYLSRFIKKYRFCAQSLSEMFQIRQTAHVIEVVIPLLGAYCAAVVFSGTCMIIILYLYFIEGHSVLSPYYLVVANAAYYSIPFYTLFSTVFMSWYFKAMRKVMIQDLKSLFGIEISHQTDVHPEKLDPEEEGRIYFEQLQESWK